MISSCWVGAGGIMRPSETNNHVASGAFEQSRGVRLRHHRVELQVLRCENVNWPKTRRRAELHSECWIENPDLFSRPLLRASWAIPGLFPQSTKTGTQ